MTNPAPEPHLDPHEISGYLEGTVAPAQRARLEAHLADCEECTAEMVAVSRLRRPAGRAMRWAGAAAIAAAVLAVVVVGRPHERGAGHAVRERGDTSGSAVHAVAPAEGAVVSSGPLLVWNAVPGASTYRVAVTRANGDSVWAAAVRDTTARVTNSTLVPGTY
jgi:anti-sigma factor RsiW